MDVILIIQLSRFKRYSRSCDRWTDEQTDGGVLVVGSRFHPLGFGPFRFYRFNPKNNKRHQAE